MYYFYYKTIWEAHLPKTNYSGGSPPHQLLTSIYTSKKEANECLKVILEDIKKSGFRFEGEIKNNLVIGEFRND